MKSCRKLSNYIARTKNGKTYVKRGFYCKTCGKKITKVAFDVFNGDCGPCSTSGF